jgi:hypothetical protein
MRASRGRRSMATPVIGTDLAPGAAPASENGQDDNKPAGKRVVHDHFGEVQTSPPITTESKWLII